MLIEPNCSKRGCVHFWGHNRPDGTDESLVHICRAYPGGIPDEIAFGDDLHPEVKIGQTGGYVFETLL